ncbi:hypothetical protein HPB50_027109 [Hyalomma asiaticum]|uniref:Uncharacterized protein n=1 Tax=Hyalomma asiaticum TaxID=266040 RepID=A0ACB7SZS4_HYAAI|nr:hypothetical protein HPB50_027109 [Hyalomma asiaticum]
MAWKKEKIQEWLRSKNITYGERMIKQLHELVASVMSCFLSIVVVNRAVRAGCIALLPYHWEFNPIELLWAKVKNGIAADNSLQAVHGRRHLEGQNQAGNGGRLDEKD